MGSSSGNGLNVSMLPYLMGFLRKRLIIHKTRIENNPVYQVTGMIA
jgi:hypothetical protein